MSAPSASPSHQSTQSVPRLAHGWIAATHSVSDPIVALIAVLRMAPAATNRATSRIRGSVRSKPDARRRSDTATTASSVLPTATVPAVQIGTLVPTFARNAPTETATPEQQCCLGDASRRPDGRHLFGDERELEPHARREDVRAGYRDADRVQFEDAGAAETVQLWLEVDPTVHGEPDTSTA
jgi:hypothetical protein